MTLLFSSKLVDLLPGFLNAIETVWDHWQGYLAWIFFTNQPLGSLPAVCVVGLTP